MLRVLINRYGPETGKNLLKFLPDDHQEQLNQISIQSEDLKPILQHPQKCLYRVHYSWIKPLIDRFPPRVRPSLIAALNAEQISGMRAKPDRLLPNISKSFIVNEFCYLLDIDKHIPLEYLPQTDLSPLSHWTKQELVTLIDFLGLHDLASEVRHIVNRDHLKNIYTCLTPKQFYYLKVCMNLKDRLVTPKLGIDPNQQDCRNLKQVLHRRGLSRLGKALCGQHPDFIWYLVHTLDMGRGNIIQQEYQAQPLPKITPILIQQVLNLMNFLKNE